MKLLLNQSTQKSVDTLLSHPVHGILIEGPNGSGKYTLGLHIIGKLGRLAPDALENYQYFLHIQPTIKKNLGIEDIRTAQHFLRLKTTGKNNLRRFVLISQASTMSEEAQNALLKTLEEPPEDTVIVLLVEDSHQLLPTCISRLRTITVKPASLEASYKYFESANITKKDFDKLYYLSDGYVGVLYSLIYNNSPHPLYDAVGVAKSIIASPRYERLCKIEELAKNKEQAQLIIDALRKVSRAMLYVAIKSQNPKQIKKWHNNASLIIETQSNIKYNPQYKLLLTNLFINL